MPQANSSSRSLVKLRAVIPEDAFTAGILGSERVGNGVIISPNGLILTIGYLITEAADVWLTLAEGREIAGHALAYDQVTGFGLVMPLQNPDIAPVRFGVSAHVAVGDALSVVSFPEFASPQRVHVSARREFTGAWESLLEGALFTVPAHPHWSGAALMNADDELVGVGSLLVRESVAGEEVNANMFVPIDLLKPILPDFAAHGRTSLDSRPWLGVYAVEVNDKVYVTGVADGSPAQLADIREGDLIAQVDNQTIGTLAQFYRRLWSLGPAGVAVPLSVIRGGTRLHINVRSVDRMDLLKRPQPN
jgi:S1-C subfamily serine protease